ncbi:MAG: hypothetical protein CMJ70_22405 [Planctomycetaceae bacterium]|nr:hypothetical protein [Planctomycetaceae bacterium]
MLDRRVGAGGLRAGSDRCRVLPAKPDQNANTTENRSQVNPNWLGPRGGWSPHWLTTVDGPSMLAIGFQVAEGIERRLPHIEFGYCFSIR